MDSTNSKKRKRGGRCWHILRENQNTETIHQAIFFDTETHEKRIDPQTVEHHLTFGWACYRKVNRHGNWSQSEWCRFETSSEFWGWVERHCRPKSKLWLFCLNTNFDIPVLHTFREMSDRGWGLTQAVIDGPPTFLTFTRCIERCPPAWLDPQTGEWIRCKHPKRTIAIMDTLNIWRLSAAKLGKRYGLEKLPMPSKDASREEWDLYGKRDVEIIMAAVLRWVGWLHDNDFGGFAPTLASQAMRCYRHRFMWTPILIDNHESALDVCRDAYHGGRVECGRIGSFTGEFYLLDVNSMYPWVMRDRWMPAKLAGYLSRCDGLDLRGYLNRYCCVAEVTLKTTVPFAGIVRDDKLIFPIGRFKAHLTTPELEYGLELGCIEKIHRMALYQRAVLFREFVDALYEMRTQCIERDDQVGSFQFKILLNSFYGKWGQSGKKWKTVGTCEPSRCEVLPDVNAQTEKVRKLRYFGGCVQELQVDRESFESSPAIAAHITAHARLELFKIILQAGTENYLYCDTDAVLVTLEGRQRLEDRIDAIRLGGLKQVGKYSNVVIYGPKDYILDGKQTLKGVRPSANQIGLNTWQQERWSSLKGLVRENSLDAPRTRTIVKTLGRFYSKGMVSATGHVQPFALSE